VTPKIAPQANAVASGRNLCGLTRHATRQRAMAPAVPAPSGSRIVGATLTAGDSGLATARNSARPPVQHRTPGADDPVGPSACQGSRDHDGEQQVQDKDRLHQGQRSEVQSDGLHRRSGDVDCDSDQPEPVDRQISKEPQVQRRPICHCVRGTLLDDIGRAKRDSARYRNQHGDQLIHCRLIPCPPHADRRTM